MIDTASAIILGQSVEVAVVAQPRRLEITLARTRSDLIGAFRILYNAYLRAGLVGENSHQVRLTPFHLLPTTEVVVAKLEDTVTSTITMVADSCEGLPMDTMYSEELDELRRSGLQLAEIGCLADRRHSPVRFIKVFGELARLVVQIASHRGIGALVVATHPRHAGFYMRSFGFEQFGTLKGCPYVQGNPAVAMILNFARIRETPLHDCLFGNPFQETELIREGWDDDTTAFLRELLAATDA